METKKFTMKDLQELNGAGYEDGWIDGRADMLKDIEKIAKSDGTIHDVLSNFMMERKLEGTFTDAAVKKIKSAEAK